MAMRQRATLIENRFSRCAAHNYQSSNGFSVWHALDGDSNVLLCCLRTSGAPADDNSLSELVSELRRRCRVSVDYSWHKQVAAGPMGSGAVHCHCLAHGTCPAKDEEEPEDRHSNLRYDTGSQRQIRRPNQTYQACRNCCAVTALVLGLFCLAAGLLFIFGTSE